MEIVKPFADDPKRKQLSLIEEAMELKKNNQLRMEPSADDVKKIEEMQILEAMRGSALMTVKAKAQTYQEPLKTTWRPPKKYRWMTYEERRAVLQKHRIDIEGEDIPPPVSKFSDMRLPQVLLDAFKEKGILKPTPIQLIGLPTALSGRDMIGIAFTGSGKTLVFMIPLIMMALEEEKKMPIVSGEGPFGLLLVPSHELAIQTFETVNFYCKKLQEGGFPRLKTILCIGGIDVRQQVEQIRNGIHIVVATPGRLSDLLNRGKMNLNLCKYICLDEADRLLDVAFEQEISRILDSFTMQRQTLLFSSTMPKKIQDFTKQALIKPVIINVGRAGAASMNVVQEVEYVKEDSKLVYLLECLKKTGPPVLIFCENKNDVDDIQEYLLLKGVEANALHGGKDQHERAEAVEQFKSGKKEVLVATDVAAKGLDFPSVKHVINYDMPKDIESYIHRIGRTGRRGKTGLATTFINKSQDPNILLDLKYILAEAKQYVPAFLKALRDSNDSGEGECTFCGGLGHRMINCAKLESHKQKAQSANNAKSDSYNTQPSRFGSTKLGGGDI